MTNKEKDFCKMLYLLQNTQDKKVIIGKDGIKYSCIGVAKNKKNDNELEEIQISLWKLDEIFNMIDDETYEVKTLTIFRDGIIPVLIKGDINE